MVAGARIEQLFDQDAVLAAVGAGADPGYSMGVTRTPNADRPTLVAARAKVVTDGVDNGQIEAYVDDSGGATGDYFPLNALADKDAGGPVTVYESALLYVPAGGSYAFNNWSDPSGQNAVEVWEYTL